MNKYIIHGGRPLMGEVTISGAKNAAVAIIPAALLVDGVCRIENVPQISDVTLILQILRELGADIKTVNRTTVDVDCSHIRNARVPEELARKIRASYYLIGALLGRFGSAEVPPPGGCDFGGRPIDQHIKGFVARGADVDVRGGYIHAKTIPGTSPELIQQMGYLADRLSVNVELPSEQSLHLLAPDKGRHSIFRPMKQISVAGEESRQELTLYRHAPKFAPAGQSTQMIVGASPETDYHILQLSEGMYQKYGLKRVFYSAYIPVSDDTRLPALDTKPPLLREHRLYQADWLLRFYGFRAGELLDEGQPDFDPLLDPKCCWALRHPDFFPVEVNRADYEALLRVPGIGVVSAKRILVARRGGALRAEDLKKLGVVLKRAQYFLTCSGRSTAPLRLSLEGVRRNLTATERASLPAGPLDQLSLFEPA